MFGIKKNEKSVALKEKVEKLPGPRLIPEPVQEYLISAHRLDPDLAKIFKTVMRRNHKSEREFDIRVFDESTCLAKKVVIKDYTTLDTNPDLVLYEGTFNEITKHVELKEKNQPTKGTTIFSEAEILQKIEALENPGNSVMFFMARGSANGGPLGKGCAIVELIAQNSNKKEYNIYIADVVGTQPVDKGEKLFHSNKPKKIAEWIKEAHHKRMY
jgi:hypothetical protein